MNYEHVETQEDLIDYYNGLIDFLDDHVPNLDVLIEMYEEEEA